MGTRGVVGVVVDGKEKLSYNHFDSYPSCLGQELVDFLLEVERKGQRQELKTRFGEAVLVDENHKPTPADKERYAPTADLSVSRQSLDDWYCLLRDSQGVNGMRGVLAGTLGHVMESNNFPLDSLFCEWAYVVDLDKNVLEIYKGFQKKKHNVGRFAVKKNAQNPKPNYPGAPRYYPVKLVRTVPLDELTSDSCKGLEDDNADIAKGVIC